MYTQICQEDSNLAEVWLMLGAVNGELGQVTEAITCLRTALQLQPENPDVRVTLAQVLCTTGKLNEARDHCLRATQILPDHEQAWLLLSGINGQLANPVEAERCARKTLELWPDCGAAFGNLGKALNMQGRVAEAAQAFARATELEPRRLEAWLSLAALRMHLGDTSGAEACYRAVIAQDPASYQAQDGMGLVCQAQGKFTEALGWHEKALISNRLFTDAHFHIGDAYYARGNLQKAMENYREALKINPNLAEVYNRIGSLLGESGNLEEAEAEFERALQLQPNLAVAHFNLANLLNTEGAYDRARTHYEKTLELLPRFVGAYNALGDLLQDQGKVDEAREYYRRAMQLPNGDAMKIKQATAWPIILESKEHINKIRKEFTEAVDDLIRSPNLLVKDPATEVGRTVLYPVYSGLNDLDIQLKIARLYEKASPGLLYTAPHCQKRVRKAPGARIKLGLISKHFCAHTIGKTMAGLIEQFSRDLFEITVFTFPHESDPVAGRINSLADRVVILPKDWKDAHAFIAREEIDILFYTDVGMEPYTYFLAYARLAPVQCTTWGHPVTTGLRNMDYYLTCADFEPEGADDHYSEKLIRLSSPPTYYYRLQLPATASLRSDYAWDAEKNLYLCPQTLYKFHPDFDEIIAGILRGDPNGQAVLISGRHKHRQDLLFARFKASMPDVVDRIVVLQYPGMVEYLNLLHKCDVMLDTYHYGGGTTSLQGLALGTPIVTLPGNYQRGRHTYAYYKQMNYMECVATDPTNYVEIAIRLGTDRNHRRLVGEVILAKNSVLYENKVVVREMEQFFLEAIRNVQ